MDIVLAFVEFLDDLFHSNAVAPTEKIPVSEFGGGMCTRGESPAGKKGRVTFMGVGFGVSRTAAIWFSGKRQTLFSVNS
jgi:hypothetical protein